MSTARRTIGILSGVVLLSRKIDETNESPRSRRVRESEFNTMAPLYKRICKTFSFRKKVCYHRIKNNRKDNRYSYQIYDQSEEYGQTNSCSSWDTALTKSDERTCIYTYVHL